MAILSILISFFIVVVGFGLGATLSIVDIREAAKARLAFLCGMVCQFGIMPLLAFGFASAFGLRNDVALGLILVGSCPGGTTSNLFSYWCGGRVALSVAMSAFSTVAAFGMLPLNLYLYGTLAYGISADLPYTSLVLSLLTCLVPFGVGVYIRYRNTEGRWRGLFYWQWMEKSASVSGVVFLIAAVIYGLIINIQQFKDTNPGTYVAVALMEPVGSALGFAFAAAFRLPMEDRCTISLETGIQNSTLALAVGQISFDGERRDLVMRAALLYSLFYVVHSLWITSLLRYLNHEALKKQHQADIPMKTLAERKANGEKCDNGDSTVDDKI
ncbi:hypothetical protein CYMTET_40465 [Cymbomonas tetramitiformis]|uniref:Bile acid:sodium symporter n=1 Tax=Cymbomonas tetramitiformis TaxID=36881 RepID=A0AAE0F383_9CHLO|nr:hypothetical protein CYMTET_43095 [Cymbomonas tetramitiformis]KAK3250148.1 hypothetical protein CYMTET_40465 [Cymbomonas tetramitiformis]|eukprot:gene27286-33604_t